MQLHFYAKSNLLVSRPDVRPTINAPARYVGRKFDSATLSYPATEAGEVFDSDTPAGKRLMKLARRDRSLWAANKATATACGIDYLPLRYDAGEWRYSSLASKKSST